MAKIGGLASSIVALASVILLEVAVAQETEKQPQRAEQETRTTLSKPISSKIDYYDVDNKTNQIPYFDNRFRIDANIEEISLLFYRETGSPPIILVRPDGTKIRINNLDKENTIIIQRIIDTYFL